MADAKKCDRCGGYYEEREPNALDGLADALNSIIESIGNTPEKINPDRISHSFDLCSACEKSFKKWWKERK